MLIRNGFYRENGLLVFMRILASDWKFYSNFMLFFLSTAEVHFRLSKNKDQYYYLKDGQIFITETLIIDRLASIWHQKCIWHLFNAIIPKWNLPVTNVILLFLNICQSRSQHPTLVNLSPYLNNLPKSSMPCLSLDWEVLGLLQKSLNELLANPIPPSFQTESTVFQRWGVISM